MKFRYTLLLLDSNLILPSPSLAFLPLQSTSLHPNPTPSPQTLLKVLPVISNKIFKQFFFLKHSSLLIKHLSVIWNNRPPTHPRHRTHQTTFLFSLPISKYFHIITSGVLKSVTLASITNLILFWDLILQSVS